MYNRFIFLAITLFFTTLLTFGSVVQKDSLRNMKYSSRDNGAATKWQEEVRTSLSVLLKTYDLQLKKSAISLSPEVIRTEDKGNYELREITFNSTPGRRIQAIVTIPENDGNRQFPAVICIHGHGGKMTSVFEEESIYKGFAHVLASHGFVTISTVVSQHQVYEEGRLLMGERLWDLMRCVDFLETLEMVDETKIGCAGLSLGGEMAMWLGGMDPRIRAVVSSGFLTKMDQMEHNHCMCWKFPGLREIVDFPDIYSLIAPRPLMCQNGEKEPADQFFVPLAREAFREIQVIYADLYRPENVILDVHNGGHEIDLSSLVWFLEKNLKEKVEN